MTHPVDWKLHLLPPSHPKKAGRSPAYHPYSCTEEQLAFHLYLISDGGIMSFLSFSFRCVMVWLTEPGRFRLVAWKTNLKRSTYLRVLRGYEEPAYLWGSEEKTPSSFFYPSNQLRHFLPRSLGLPVCQYFLLLYYFLCYDGGFLRHWAASVY